MSVEIVDRINALFAAHSKLKLEQTGNGYDLKMADEVLCTRTEDVLQTLQQYLKIPAKKILDTDFEDYVFTDFLKAGDKRNTKSQIVVWTGVLKNYAAVKVVCRRLYPQDYE